MPLDKQQLLSFHAGEVEWAVDLSLVLEVIRFTGMARLAGLAGALAGAIHRHGGLLPIVDLQRHSARPPRQLDNHSRILVLDASGHEVGVLVDHLGEIVQLAASAIHPLPRWLSASQAPYFQGLAMVEGRWLLILAPAQLLPDDVGSSDASPWAAPLPSEVAEAQEARDTAIHPKRACRAKAPRRPQQAAAQEVQLQSTLDAQSLRELEEMAKAMSEGDFHRQISSKVQGELENLAAYIAKTMSNLQLLEPSVRLSAEREIPTASQQLSDVLKSTEEATNTIMSLTDILLDHQAVLGEAIEKLRQHKHRSRAYQEIIDRIEHLHREDEKTLMEIITNLSFQDLTGQRINKIVTMVATVQNKLCELIQAFGIKVRAEVPEAVDERPTGEEAGKLAQDSVDSLLNQLFN
jgi:chemotaxis protein CheZ